MTYQRDYDRRLRVALVGAGGHAYRNILPALNYLPVDLRAVCDVDRRRAEATAAQYGAGAVHADFDELLAAGGVDAVLLCVSGALHPELAAKAMRAGLHVWMEKPPALSAAGVEEMLAARGDRVCVVGFKKAFMPAATKLRELLRAHGGELISLLATYRMSIPADGAAALDDPDRGGMWTADGCHPLALMVSLAGAAHSVRTIRGARGGGACVIEFASGAIGNLHLAEGAPASQPFERYVAYGDGFTAAIENGARVVYQRGTPFDYERGSTFAPPGTDHGAIVWEAQNSLNTLENKALFVQGIHAELAHFCARALDGVEPADGTLEQAREVMRIVEAALVSDGDAVSLEGVAA